MHKIEIIHNRKVLRLIKDLMEMSHLYGFTTLNVHEGYGPLKGEYKVDHIGDEQFFTIVLLEEKEKVTNFIAALKKRSGDHKFILMTSEVNFDKNPS